MLTVPLLGVAMSSSPSRTLSTNCGHGFSGKSSDAKGRKINSRSSDFIQIDEQDNDNKPELRRENIVNEYNVQRWSDNGSRIKTRNPATQTNPIMDPPVPYFPSRNKTQPKSKVIGKSMESPLRSNRLPPSTSDIDENDHVHSTGRRSFRGNVYRTSPSYHDIPNVSSAQYRSNNTSNHLSIANNSRNSQTISASTRSSPANMKSSNEEVQASLHAASMPSTRESSYHTDGSGTIGLTPTSSSYFSYNASDAALMSTSRRSVHNSLSKHHPQVPAAVAVSASVDVSTSLKTTNIVPGEIYTTRASITKSPSGSKARLNNSSIDFSSNTKGYKSSGAIDDDSDAKRRVSDSRYSISESRYSHDFLLSPRSPQKLFQGPKQDRKLQSIEKVAIHEIEFGDQESITSDDYNDLHAHSSLNSSMRQRFYRSSDSRDSSFFSYVSKKSNTSTLPPSVPRRYESPTEFDDESISEYSDSNYKERSDIFMSPVYRCRPLNVIAIEPSSPLISSEFNPTRPPYPPSQRLEPPITADVTLAFARFREQRSDLECVEDMLSSIEKESDSQQRFHAIEDNKMKSDAVTLPADRDFGSSQEVVDSSNRREKIGIPRNTKFKMMFQRGIVDCDNDMSTARHSISSRTHHSDRTKSSMNRNSVKSNTSPRKSPRKLSSGQINNNASNSKNESTTTHDYITSGINQIPNSETQTKADTNGQEANIMEHSIKYDIDECFAVQCPQCCEVLYAFKSTIVVQCPKCIFVFPATSMTSSLLNEVFRK